MKKRLVIFLMTLIFLLMLVGCSNSSESENTTYNSEESTEEQVEEDKQIKENNDLVSNFIIDDPEHMSPPFSLKTSFSKEKNINFKYLKPMISGILVEMYNEDICYQECAKENHSSKVIYNILNEYAKENIDGSKSTDKSFDRKYTLYEINQYTTKALYCATMLEDVGLHASVKLDNVSIDSECVLNKHMEDYDASDQDFLPTYDENIYADIKITETNLKVKLDSIYRLTYQDDYDNLDYDTLDYNGYEIIASVVDKNEKEVARYSIITITEESDEINQRINNITRIDDQGKIGKSLVDKSKDSEIYTERLRSYAEMYAEAIFNKSGKNDVELLQANLIPEENRYAEVKVNGEWKGVVYHSDKTGYFSYRFLTEGEI